jgi:protein TonB
VVLTSENALHLVRLLATAADTTVGALPNVVAFPAIHDADGSRVYFAFQVEKRATPAPDNPVPEYPPMLKAANIEGQVVAQFIVDTTGHVEIGTFKILKSTHALFTSAVKSALPTMTFTPAEVGDKKVRELVQMPFSFPR